MDLAVDLHNSRENNARFNLFHIEIGAFSPIAFDRWGFPTRVTHRDKIYKYFDFYGVIQELYACFVRDFFSQATAILTSFISAEADLIRHVSDQAAELMRSRIGQERRPINGLLTQIGLFRIIMAATGAFGQSGASVFEFLSYIGVFTQQQRCLTLTDRDNDFFARVPYPYSAQDFARKIMVARRVAANRLKPGRICIYPLGDQTKAILDVLESRNDIQITAILDQRAKPGSQFNGHTLLAPEQIASGALSGVDYILISHQNETMFFSELHRLGIPDSKIATIHLEGERSGWPTEANEAEYINIMTSAWRSSLHNYGRYSPASSGRMCGRDRRRGPKRIAIRFN